MARIPGLVQDRLRSFSLLAPKKARTPGASVGSHTSYPTQQGGRREGEEKETARLSLNGSFLVVPLPRS